MSPGPWRRAGSAEGRWPLLVAFLAMGSGACTFERRADGDPPSAPALSAGDSVFAVVAAFQEARARGDVAAALALFDSEARVSSLQPAPPDSEMPPWRSAREVLQAEVWDREAGQVEVIETFVDFPGSGTALILGRYVDVAAAPGEPAVLETMVLVRQEGGWRIRHIHRSFPSPAAPPPAEP